MPTAPDLCGIVLEGRYELHELIGEGAFGRVYRGRDRRLARDVAVKVIKPWWAEDPRWVARFEREAQMLARVNDPGIVQIFDVGDGDEALYYVAELVEGESLAARLERGAFTPAEATSVALGLCRALAGAHAQGIVHRDVKPANVLLGVDGRVKVGDFGVARLAQATATSGAQAVLGTPRYMSPEQAAGGTVTAASDVYGVGVILYEMLAGRAPFEAESVIELAVRHLNDRPPPLPPHVPEQLRDVVERALRKRPEARFADAGAMAAALAPLPQAPQGRPDPSADERSTAVLPVLAAATLVDTRRHGGPPPRERQRRSLLPGLLGAGIALVAAGIVVLLALVLIDARKQNVTVPRVVGSSLASARGALSRGDLKARVVAVPSPGGIAGEVVRQLPTAGAHAPHGATVTLTIAQAPRWRTVASFVSHGSGDGQSPSFRIRGSRWRLRYSMGYDGTCTLLLYCFAPSADVYDLGSGGTLDSFDLGKGEQKTRTIDSGPGRYQVSVSAGDDRAHWAMTVQDFY